MKTKKKAGHYSRVSWYSGDYWLLNGFLLPELAYAAICELHRLGRFQSLDAAIREGIRILLEENTPMLVRSDPKLWIPRLGQLKKISEPTADANPDTAGEENMRLLNQMYKAKAKAEKEP